MKPRGVEVLKSVAVIASEDTRVTKKLCNHFEIKTPLISYHEHNQHQKTELILERLAAGEDVALTSDAGMPLVSDPGDRLVSEATRAGFAVVPIPGANAALTALIASGLSVERFFFHGFLDRKRSTRKKELLSLKALQATLLFYESPHRVKETLLDLLEVYGNREVVIARELTKVHEEFIRGKVEDVVKGLPELKGEVVLLVAGSFGEESVDAWWEGMSLTQHVEHYMDAGMKTNAAIKQVASDLQVPRQEIYKEYHT
jgi:16S rRNA (cytidine1402-2'-O)-methyltransferase